MILSEALALGIAMQKLQTEGVPRSIKLGYALVINTKRLKDIVETFEESRISLLKKYGEKDDKGDLLLNDGNVTIKDMNSFNEEFMSLQRSEVSVELQKIKLDDLPSELDPMVLGSLLPMISE